MTHRARLWLRTHPLVLAVLFFSGLAWLGFTDVQNQNDKLRNVVAQQEADRIERRREACEATLKRDEQEEAMWTEILRRVEAEPQVTEVLHEGYDALPQPTTCGPDR